MPKYFLCKDYVNSVNTLRQNGGINSKKAEKADAIWARASRGEQDIFHGISVTNHGETRIDKCIKYDLNDGYRLITIQDNDIIVFCFVGRHNKADKWLNSHKGIKTVLSKDNRISFVQADFDITSSQDMPIPLSTRNLLDELEPEDRDLIGVMTNSFSIFREILNISFQKDEESIKLICDGIANKNRSTIYDILISIKRGDTDNAIKLLDRIKGNIKEIDRLDAAKLQKIKGSDSIIAIELNDAEYLEKLQQIINSPYYQDWMLFMHPDQQKIIDSDYDGSVLLSGVSGSGKTCIIVHRAIRLAEKTNKKILILTINPSLALLIADLVNYSCHNPKIKNNIECKSFFELCREQLYKFEPNNIKSYDFLTWKTDEHIDSVWREFYRCELNNFDAKILFPLHKRFLSMKINAENYLRQEFDYARSISGGKNDYMQVERKGRAIPLQKNDREIIIKGIDFWKDKMRAVGVTDYMNISSALYKYMDRLVPMFHHVLIDEAQDFGTVELKLIRRMTYKGSNDLFFSGDITQTILPKHQNFDMADVDIKKRKLKITKNYRNSKEILKAAYDILINAIDQCDYIVSNDSLEILDPKFANRHSSHPLLLKANSFEDEISFAIEHAKSFSDNRKVCICFAGYNLSELVKFSQKYQFSILDGTKHLSDSKIFISDLEQMKGFEFDCVIILNCNKEIIPNLYLPEAESFRDICRLYVAMTRAKNELILSYSNEYSPIFERSIENESISSDEWDSYYDRFNAVITPPEHLEQFTEKNKLDISRLSGKEFLYTDYAFAGISKELLDKIEILIDGRGAYEGDSNRRIRWKTIGDAWMDVKNFPHAKNLFGPKLHVEFLNFFKTLLPSSIGN